jgi:hypothetical protein
MAKTVASRKAKGRKAQQIVVKMLLDAFPDLTARDIVSQPMGVPTEDIRLSEAAYARIPYAIEIKACEKIPIWEAIKQSESPNRKGIPLLVFKRNRSDMYCCLKFEELIKLIKNNWEKEIIVHDLLNVIEHPIGDK